ncbi:MAG: FAD-dependent oxidoreductase [Pseudomonadota bacterium]
MLTRRDLMGLLASGSAVASLNSVTAHSQGLGTDYDVIIVGAGIAGLATAEHLLSLDNELKVLVLEARDRIGGRVYSIARDDMYRDADLGAQYLSVEQGLDWEPIKRFGLQSEQKPDGRIQFYPGMAALIDAIAKASQGKIQLSSQVSEVFWREGLAGVYYQNRGLKSAVTTRRLVLTVPAAVLQQKGLKITPDLGREKQQALASVRTGPCLSCAMLFSQEKTNLIAPSDTWSRDDYGSHLRVLRNGINGELLLEAQFTDLRAEALAGETPELVLRLALQDFEQALTSMPLLEDALWTDYVDWSRENFSAGAYTQASSTSSHLSLAQSLGDTLFFAGDATSDRELVGSIAGAYESGKRAGREIAVSLALGSEEEGEEPILELL